MGSLPRPGDVAELLLRYAAPPGPLVDKAIVSVALPRGQQHGVLLPLYGSLQDELGDPAAYSHPHRRCEWKWVSPSRQICTQELTEYLRDEERDGAEDLNVRAHGRNRLRNPHEIGIDLPPRCPDCGVNLNYTLLFRLPVLPEFSAVTVTVVDRAPRESHPTA